MMTFQLLVRVIDMHHDNIYKSPEDIPPQHIIAVPGSFHVLLRSNNHLHVVPFPYPLLAIYLCCLVIAS